MRKIISLLFSFIVLFTISGCDLRWDDPCKWDPDSKHCYQAEAVNAWDPSLCSKIDGKEFKSYGSNPPRDKCYMMVAAELWDYNICNKVKWWEMSYTKQDCIFEVISQNDDPKWCDLIKDDDSKQECYGNFRSANALVMKDQRIDDITESLKDDPDNIELKDELEKLIQSKKNLFPYLSSDEQSEYIKEYRENLMDNIDDDSVKSAIAKEYTAYKNNNPDIDVVSLLDQMKSIADKQKLIKSIDEDANYLVDTVKNQMMDIAQQWQDSLTDLAKDKATQWLKENGWDNMKRWLERLERMKEKYDVASEEYAAINEKYEQLKATYDQIVNVYNKMDSFDTLVSQWKLTEDKAKVLKWAVLLQNWLTAVTEYVPVFWSTISKITDATFETTIKVAEERAKRTTALDKCIDDPLNCDTDSISAY